MIKLISLAACIAIAMQPLSFKSNAPLTTARMAEICNMTEEEFIFISSVTEAESDRSESLEGRILIAETIINRVNDSRFPDTIYSVLTQSGQFSTVRNGHSVTDRSEYSDQAVMIAVQEIEQGVAPNVLFFNCIGYNYGEPYDYVDGNYFMTWEV